MQFDFLSMVPASTGEATQFSLWNESLTSAAKIAPAVTYGDAEAFFHQLDGTTISAYKNYWQSIVPRNDVERFQRWLFAFLSVHSTWNSNIKGYLALKNWTEWFNRWDVLEQRLADSGVGLNNIRLRFLKQFASDYWSNPSDFTKGKDETWAACRNRLVERVLGLGFAKVSFALEMLAPNEADVACMDIHLLRLYGLKNNKHEKLTKEIEAHWVQMSRMWNCPAPIARAILWDRKQKQTNSRYWTHVLETV